jgi:hypothetical protein
MWALAGVRRGLAREAGRLQLWGMAGVAGSRCGSQRRVAAALGARTAGDGAEALLPRGVPNLQLDPLAVDQHLFDLKIDPAAIGGSHDAMRAAVPAPGGSRPAACRPSRRCHALPYPMVVMKLEVKLSSAKRSSRQLLPTPAEAGPAAAVRSARPGHPPGSLQRPLPVLTAVSDEQQLYEVVIVLPLRHSAPARN